VNIKSILRSGVAFSVLVGTLGISVPGYAADEEAEGTLFMDEIIVSARKRNENIQEIPVSVTALTGDFIDEANINNVVDIADFTPGFSFASAFGRQGDRPVIRGQSSIQGPANAAFFVDGVYISGSAQSILLDNLERVEVIKGPQSAIYGRATFAGAINYITKRPTNEMEGKVSFTIGEHENFEASGFLSGAITEDKLFFNIGGKFYNFGGDYENSFPGLEGESIGQEQTFTINTALFFNPTETFEAIFKFDYSEDNDGHYAIGLQPGSENNCFLGVARQYFCGEIEIPEGAPRLETNFFDRDAGIKRDTLRTSLTLNADVGGHTLTSITAYSKRDTRAIQDQTYAGEDNRGFFRFGFITDDDTDLKTFSQELRITSPGDQDFRYLFGAYYFSESSETFSRGSGGSPTADLTYNGRGEIENIAIFGQAQYDITDQLTFSAELRWAEETVRDFQTEGVVSDEQKYKAWTPRFTLDYQATDNLLIYASASRGNKPGTINTQTLLPDELRPVDEEKLWSYEIGLKSTFMDGRGLFNLAAYYIDWTGQQLTQVFIDDSDPMDPNLFTYLDNVGETRVLGFEAELFLQVTDELSLNAIYAFNESEIQSYDLRPDARMEAELFGFSTDGVAGIVSGTVNPQNPQHTLTLSGEFRTPVANNGFEFFLRTDYIFSSTRYAQVYNFAGTGSRHLVNMRTGIENDKYSFAIWAKNLFDDDTPTSILRYVDVPSFFAIRAFGVSLPRTQQFGASATIRF